MRARTIACVLSLWSSSLSELAWAADVDCSSATAVQSAVDAAASGDTLKCTAGGTWDSTVEIPSTKALTLDGNAKTITRGGLADKQSLISLNTHATELTRVTGFTFVAPTKAAGFFIGVGGGFSNAKFRIDNSTFTANDMGTSIVVSQAWGV